MRMQHPRDDERGSALVISLFLMMALSVVGASLMFLSQTETYASMNYRLMSQARYGAESGVHKTVNYLLNAFTPPSVADFGVVYDITKSPVELVANPGQPVILSADAAVAANYPDAAVQTAFAANAQGDLAVGNGSVHYAAYATLLSMQNVDSQPVMTWQITANGSMGTVRTATVEVTSILEKQLTPQTSDVYAAFAKSGGCGALNFSSSTVDSYDSTIAVAPGNAPVIDQHSGNVGTNGNLNESNGSTVYGTLSTPRVGVGNCSAGNVDALTSRGGAEVTGGVIQLSQDVVPPTPDEPDPLPPTDGYTFTDASGCLGVSGCTVVNGNEVLLAPGAYGDVHGTNAVTIHLSAGTYDINSLQMNNGTQLVIDSGPVVINLTGYNAAGQPMGAGDKVLFINSSMTLASGNEWDAQQLTFNYAGSSTIELNNEGSAVGRINAPNASVVVNSADFYGSIVGNTVRLGNQARLHFDRHLSTVSPTTFTVGADMLTAFTWKKY